MFGRRSAVLLSAVVLAFSVGVVLGLTVFVVDSQLRPCGSWLGCLRLAWLGNPNFRTAVFLVAAVDIIAVVIIAAVSLIRRRKAPPMSPSPPTQPPM